jgi:signal transduction histidine kinase
MKFRLQPRSIAFRLIVAVLAVEMLSCITVAALSFGYERHIHFRAFDVMLHGRADSILGAVQDAEDPGDNVMLDQADLHIPSDDVYEVWDANGRLLGRSSNWEGPGKWEAADSWQGEERDRDHGGPEHHREYIARLTIHDRHYRLLRIQGSRTVDPGEHGGKLRQVTVIYGAPTARVWQSINGAVEFYAAGSLFLLLVTGPLIAWLLHRGLLPLRQLAALASQVSVDSWQFSPPASARATPELAPLTHALESVMQRLERSFLQQRAFVSDAAHELKTAVAVVKSSLQLLNMKPRSAQEYQAGLERCLADSQRLEALVADMLALARAESSAPAPGPRPSADFTACIQQTVTQLETFAALRNVQVQVSNRTANQTAIPVSIPAEDCTLLLSNLLLNAIQHSPPASIVEIDLTMDADQGAPTAVLVIQDHGDGIPAQALPHVFDRFYRGDPSRTRNTGGTGLGLAIAKAIAQKAAGSIDLASQPNPAEPNQGTAVTVRLPIAPSPIAEN